MRRFLGEYGRAPARVEATPLPGGWENLNLRIDAGGERLVLRRYDSTAPEEVPWEIALLRHLAAHGFPTPAPLPRTDGELLGAFGGRPAALFRFVSGRHPSWDDPAGAVAAAEAIAELHRVTAGVAIPHPRTRLEVGPRLARFRAWVAGRADGAARAPLVRLVAEVDEYEKAFSERLAQVERASGQLPRGVVHTDAHGNNLLLDEGGRLVALLDFDDAHEGMLLRDVCMLIDTWGVERRGYRFEPPRARRVLAAYARRRALTVAERELLPDALALFNLAETTSYVTGRIIGGTVPEQAIADCGQYARYRERTGALDWRERLRGALLADSPEHPEAR